MKAKVDTTQIPNFEGFPDDVKSALSDFEFEVQIPDPDYSGYVKKEVFDKKAKEASDLSKQLRAGMTEKDQIAAEKEDLINALTAERDALRKEKTISSFKAEYLSLGYDEELASATALAMAEGDMGTVFANQKAFMATHKKQMEKELLNRQPDLSVGMPPENQKREDAELAKLRKSFG